MLRVVNSSTPTPNHAWVFTDCDTGQDIMDTGEDGGKTASPVNVSSRGVGEVEGI